MYTIAITWYLWDCAHLICWNVMQEFSLDLKIIYEMLNHEIEHCWGAVTHRHQPFLKPVASSSWNFSTYSRSLPITSMDEDRINSTIAKFCYNLTMYFRLAVERSSYLRMSKERESRYRESYDRQTTRTRKGDVSLSRLKYSYRTKYSCRTK